MRPATMALVVAVPGLAGEHLTRLQRALDPYGNMPPHIPLTLPFVAEPPFLAVERSCWRTGHDQPSFWIELGELVIDKALAWLPVVSGGEHLRDLREALLGAGAGQDGDDVERAIAARIAFRDELAITVYREQSDAPGFGRCFVDRFQLMAQYPDGSWYERDFYTLDRAVATA